MTQHVLIIRFQEERFSDAIDNETTKDFLHEVMRECAIRLENEPDYPLLKDELRKKLKK
jgi:hypothetical protein